MCAAGGRVGAIFAWSEGFSEKARACERSEWSLRNEVREQALAGTKIIRGGVNGVYGMNTTTPLKKNEKQKRNNAKIVKTRLLNTKLLL